jgi:lipoprotein-anchoring transpeptidase ErfK/SrfK
VAQTTRATSYGTPLRWLIACDVTARCRWGSEGWMWLIRILDDNGCVKLAAVVALAAGALVLAPAPAGSAVQLDRHCRPGVLHPVGTRTTAFAATVGGRTLVYRRPGGGRLAAFAKLNGNGFPTTFSIVGAIVNRTCGASWYRVRLPLRPNGVVGYVRPEAMVVRRVATQIVVDLSERRLTLLRDGRPVLTTRAAVGAASTPTPTGRFYVDQRVLTGDPGGAYGPAALGVSAFSTALTGWARGRQIAIHGTNQPWSIGHAASNGCIRVANVTLARIFAATPAGSPVLIRP